MGQQYALVWNRRLWKVNIFYIHNFLCDIINLNENTCYGQFTCEYTQRLWDLLRNGDDLTKAYELVNEIVQLEQVVNDSEGAQQFGDRLGVDYDNADLVIMMRLNNNLISGENKND